MSELMKIIRERRSIRKYESAPVPEALLAQVLEAVKWAPSWANTQCWEIIVVESPEVKQRLQEIIGPKNPATKAILAAPLVLAVCGKRGAAGCYENKFSTKFGDWMLFDLGIATQNICLAAHDAGLGTVIVGLFDHDKAGEILDVPPTHEVVVLIPLGYPAKSPSAPKRRPENEFVHHDRF